MKRLIIPCLCLSLIGCSQAGQNENTIKEEKKEEVSKYSSGDTIRLGSYEQDGDLENGAEPIEWIVLNDEDSKVTLISQNILELETVLTMNNEAQFFDSSWENSSERYWLNNEFIENAFTKEERDQIIETTLDNASYSFTLKGEKESTAKENNTNDFVYSISVQEYEQFFEDVNKAIATPSQYVLNEMASFNENAQVAYNTRSCNDKNQFPIVINKEGKLVTYVPGVPGVVIGIRPVITIKE
ncbi:MAG: hypothetical protein KBT48_07585 [Firmicutes bacterium]|nr:hypothetical protein [Bacillota bacterium]